MSDKNSNRKNAARVAKAQPTDYQQMKASLIGASPKILSKANELVTNGGVPTSKIGLASLIGRSIAPAGKDLAIAGKYFAKGFTDGVSWQTGDKTPAANRTILNYNIAQKRKKADQIRQNRVYAPKAQKVRQKKTMNKGISSFKNMARGQSSFASKGSSSGKSKGGQKR